MRALPWRPADLPTTPADALRRVRAAHLMAICLVAGSVAVGSWWVHAASFAVCALAWGTVESAAASLPRSLDDLSAPKRTLKRQLGYAGIAGLIGVVSGKGPAVAHILVLLGIFAVVSVSLAVLLQKTPVLGRLGVRGGGSVIAVGERLALDRWLSSGSADAAGWSVAGVCLSDGSERDRGAVLLGTPLVGTVDDVVAMAGALHVSRVVMVDRSVEAQQAHQLAWGLEELGVELTVLTGITGVSPTRLTVSTAGPHVGLRIRSSRPSAFVRRLKAVAEATLAFVGLVLTLPVLIVCALAIKADSAGPALYWQERVREGGRTFRMAKFRTMTVDADRRRHELEALNEVGGGLFKMRADPRVTRVGRVLRRLSLDELPQLWNVYRGEMALVGPRPALPAEVATYDKQARRRLAVKPGLTGLWQVSGRSRLTWEESVALDIDYVDNWSPRRDVAIVLSTVRAVASREGAY